MPSWKNALLKISASFFIWFKSYHTLNFVKNQSKLPTASCKQDFSKFGVKELAKENKQLQWTLDLRVFHPNEPFLPSEKFIFRSTRELFGEVWNKYQSSKLLLILSTSYVNILLILIQLLYNSRFYSRLYFKNVL